MNLFKASRLVCRQFTEKPTCSAGDSLKQAQLNKLDALIERANIKSTDHVLEIGCGWGSMAIHAVQVKAQSTCTQHPAKGHTRYCIRIFCAVHPISWIRRAMSASTHPCTAVSQ